MDESINNIYFLKETIGKFKNELQKFISDPNQQKHNILTLRQNVEELEKNITKKERSIGNQILNNNIGSFVPIANRALNTRGNSSGLTKLNSASNFNLGNTVSGKFPANNMGLSVITSANQNNCNNNIQMKTASINNNILNTNSQGFNNLDSRNRTLQLNSNTFNINANLTNYNNPLPVSTNQYNNLTYCGNLYTQNTNILAATGPLGIRNLNSANNPGSNSFNKNNFDSNNNNRTEIIPNLNYIPESYYDLMYKAKRKEIIPEYSTPQYSNGFYSHNIEARPKDQNLEKQAFKSTLLLRRAKDELHSSISQIESQHYNKTQTENLMNKHNIKTNKNTKFKKIKRAAGSVNYMDKNKIQKYANHSKNLYNGVTYDNKQAPVITQDEINKGILSMINRGLIPKTADLTPAFNRNGHPITLAKGEALRDLYAKTKIRDEIELGSNFDKVKYNFSGKDDNLNSGNNFFLTSGVNENQSMRDYINYNNVFYNNSASYENDTKDVVKTIPSSIDMQVAAKEENGAININDNVYVQETHLLSAGKSNLKTISILNENDAVYIKPKENKERAEMLIKDKVPEMQENEAQNAANEKENILSQGEMNNRLPSHKIDQQQLQPKKPVYLIKMLIFKNFKIIENDEFRDLLTSREDRQGTVFYLVEHFQKIFKKLNMSYAEVDLKKFENLIKDELKNITNKDLIGCLTEKDLKAKGYDNNKTFHLNLKEAFVVRIQKFYRMHKAILNYYELRTKMRKIRKLQRNYRLYRIFKNSKILVEEKRLRNMILWRIMMDNFKANWPQIKKGPRVEIHINSLSFSYIRNCTMEKFPVKENNQLNRLINLLDPNVEIIYVAPFPLGNEVLSYYFSILSTLGVNDAKERFHLIVPEEINYYAPSFSLTQVLWFSSESLTRIRKKIKGKNSYIVPGVVSKYDLTLSIFLECPIMMDEFELTKTLFSKSGSKRVFELTNMAFPISAWDIRNEEEFFNSLIDLIRKYITVNIWIFKMDTEVNGRGIAYIQLDKIKAFVELRKERQSGIIDDDLFELGLRDFIKKAVLKNAEMITPNLYKNFKLFLKEFCENQGVIESCPTNSLSGITGSPAISMFIEPDGNLELIGTYDKINLNYFRNIAALAPQTSIPNLNIELIIERLGKYLYKQGIIGYITIEYITFLDGQKTLFWAIDLKFGYTDTISCMKFCDGLDNFTVTKLPNQLPTLSQTNSQNININSYSYRENLKNTNLINNISPKNNENNNSNSQHSSNPLTKNNDSSLSINLKHYMDSQHRHRFILPVIIHPEIANLKMRDLVSMFRNELLVYDLEKRNGVVFNLPDIIQCGMFGICGIARNKEDCYKLFENSIHLVKNIITRKDNKNITLSIELRSDLIDTNDLAGRIKYFLKNSK